MMKIARVILLLGLISLMLAACAPATTMPSVAEPGVITNPATAQPAATVDASSTLASPTENTPVEVKPAACIAGVSPIRGPDPTQVAMAAGIPETTEFDQVRGNANGTVTILEYSDYMCPYCGQFTPVVNELLKMFPDDIRYVFRNFPLPSHNLSLFATQAAEAAGLQDKFWEMSDYLMLNQSEWTVMDQTAFEAFLIKKAGDFGLDTAKFTTDLKSEAMVKRALAIQQSSSAAGVSFTPFIMVNGRLWEGTDLNNMSLLIQLLKQETEQYKECPPNIIDASKKYTATVETAKGNIVIELFADKAPLSVNSFVFLTNEGWYNNQSFFEVVKSTEVDGLQVAVAGDHSKTGFGSAGYQIDAENLTRLYDKKGLVGMVNGSQFFITMGPQPKLDGRFSVIGEVVEGLDIVESLSVTTSPDGQVLPGEQIIRVTIAEK